MEDGDILKSIKNEECSVFSKSEAWTLDGPSNPTNDLKNLISELANGPAPENKTNVVFNRFEFNNLKELLDEFDIKYIENDD